jgi:hypothetical protein
VVFDQRFDSALRLELHFHGLWPDGVFACSPEGGGRFHDAGGITETDLERIVRRVCNRVLRFLARRGLHEGEFAGPAASRTAGRRCWRGNRHGRWTVTRRRPT